MFNKPPTTAAANRDPVLDDIAAVARIDVVKQILEVICRSTGLGYAAIARVTDGRWIACAARDEMAFGLEPGGELEVETTICHQVRCRGRAVTIDDTETDAEFNNHSAPQRYGFRSCISVPIRLADGSIFGTLCAIAPKPIAVTSPEVLGMFTLFADLIAKHLDSQRRLSTSEAALAAERRAGDARRQVSTLLNRDLQAPLAALQQNAAALARVAQHADVRNLVADLQANLARVAQLLESARSPS
jgi:GAF domain-containing protein